MYIEKREKISYNKLNRMIYSVILLKSYKNTEVWRTVPVRVCRCNVANDK